MARDGRVSGQPGSGGIVDGRNALFNAYAYHLRNAELYRENGIGEAAERGAAWHERRSVAIASALEALCIIGEQHPADLHDELESIGRTVARSVHGD